MFSVTSVVNDVIMGPNSGGGKRNKTDAAKVSSARGRFSNCAFPGNSKVRTAGEGGLEKEA